TRSSPSLVPMDSKLLSDIALICAIVALILAIIIPAIICYFGCICSCCCVRAKDNYVLEKEEKGKSVRYSVRSTRSESKSQSREGGSHSKRAARAADAPSMA
ncbi:hypothetical protein PENTCL1PPCAC_7668, partial [Pristionchus entomophagus]